MFVKVFFNVFLFFFIRIQCNENSRNLIIDGILDESNGWGKISYNLLQILKDDIKVNFKGRCSKYDQLPTDIKSLILKNDSFYNKSNVLLYINLIASKNGSLCENISDSQIKIAYTMTESDHLPESWAAVLNNKFDLVVVPDEYLVDVFKKSGVVIPIFILPIYLDLKCFLDCPLKRNKNKIFTFGMSAVIAQRKNHLKLVEAFLKEFGDDDYVKLIIHSNPSFFDLQIKLNLLEKIKNKKNIIFLNENLSLNNYIDFFLGLDCYVFISKGEGFSITPREAMSMGIPCIISNNTSQITICKTGLVRAIESANINMHIDPYLGKCGFNFDCNEDDVRKALRDVYDNYNLYLDKSSSLREWAMQYDSLNLKKRFISLVKPKDIIFGNFNYIGEDIIITDSIKLYDKYKILLSKN